MQQKWKQLEKDLSGWLQKHESQRLTFRNPYQAIVGFPKQAFRSDGMLTDGKTMLAIEVEAGQMHPDTNVGKYWFLNDQFHQYKKIILVHIFTPAFNSYEWRMKLANFYVEKMQGHIPIEYILQDYRKTQESYSQVLKNLEVLLQTKLAEAFP